MSFDRDNWRPRRVEPRLKSAPKIRQLYWCDLPQDAHLPEMSKRRPVIVLSFKKTQLYGTVVVIPCTTKPQQDDESAFPLETTIDGRAGWAICDKPMTVAVSRLVPADSQIPRMPEAEFDKVLDKVLSFLPKLTHERSN